jgi:20S proteasome subunit beta 1
MMLSFHHIRHHYYKYSTMMIFSTSTRFIRNNVQLLPLLLLLLLLGLSPNAVLASSSSSDDISMGTTILAMKYKDGVIVAADTRTSSGTYVSNKVARKINIILDGSTSQGLLSFGVNNNGNGGKTSCVIGRAGAAADTQWLATKAKDEFTHRARRQLLPTVSQVAHYLKYQIRTSRHSLQASLICAGYDDTDTDDTDTNNNKQPRIYSIAPNGSLLEEDIFCVSGSGSMFILGHLDHELRDGSNHLEEADAIAMVTRMLQLSIRRDGSSGGLIRILVMNAQDGLKEITVYPESPPLTTTTTTLKHHPDHNLSGFAKATPMFTKASGGGGGSTTI